MELKGGSFLEGTMLRKFAEVFCSTMPKITQPVCANIMFFIDGGWDSAQMNYTRIPVYVGQDPAGTSIRNIVR